MSCWTGPRHTWAGRNGLVGPEVTWRWKTSFQAQAGIDLPVMIENNGFQIVQDYRFNARLIWRF